MPDGWSREQTIARRGEWNRIARARKIRDAKSAKVAEMELGWSVDELKRAVASYGL